MAIANIANKETGLSVRNKLNAAIDKVNIVSSKFATVAFLVAASLEAGESTGTNGYTTAGDGAGAGYFIKTAAQAASDGDIIGGPGNHTLANGNIAVLQVGGAVFNTSGGFYRIRQFGAIGDNVAIDTPSCLAAIAACAAAGGGTVWGDVGTYKQDAVWGTIPEGVKLDGEYDKTHYSWPDDSDATFRNIVSLAANNTAIRRSKLSTGWTNCIMIALGNTAVADDFDLERVTLDGTLTDQASHTARTATHGISLAGSSTGFKIKTCTIKNLFFGIFRSTGNTGDVVGLDITGTTFDNNFNDHVELNSPTTGSLFKNVNVSENNFNDIGGDNPTSGTDAIMLGLSGACENLTVNDNRFNGQCAAAIHWEEFSGETSGTISGNTGIIKEGLHTAGSGGGTAIEMFDNNASGADFSVKSFALAGNSFTVESGETGTRGLWFGIAANTAAIKSAKNFTATGNSFDGFTTGAEIENADAQIVAENLFVNCTNGIKTDKGSPNIRYNTIDTATTALVVATEHGQFGYHYFKNITNAISAPGGRTAILGWSYERSAVSIASGIVTVDIFPDTPHSAHGVVQLSLTRNDTATSYTHAAYDYTRQATAAATTANAFQASNSTSTFNTTPKDNGNAFAIDVNNTGALDTHDLQVTFEGIFVF